MVMLLVSAGTSRLHWPYERAVPGSTHQHPNLSTYRATTSVPAIHGTRPNSVRKSSTARTRGVCGRRSVTAVETVAAFVGAFSGFRWCSQGVRTTGRKLILAQRRRSSPPRQQRLLLTVRTPGWTTGVPGRHAGFRDVPDGRGRGRAGDWGGESGGNVAGAGMVG